MQVIYELFSKYQVIIIYILHAFLKFYIIRAYLFKPYLLR